MNATLAALARDKEILLTRSALCRLRLRRETHDLRTTLPWNRAIVAVANAPAARRIAFGLALSVVGVGRATRAVLLAGRLILAARLARLAIGYARRNSRSPVYAIESTATSEGTGQYVDDSVITTKVEAAIFEEPTLKSSEINVETFKGVVQLSGFVGSQDRADTAVLTARNVKGVASVKNDMRLK